MTGELAMLFAGLAIGFLLGLLAGTATGLAMAKPKPAQETMPDED